MHKWRVGCQTTGRALFLPALTLAVVCGITVKPCAAQAVTDSSCTLAAPSLTPTAPNIFTDAQEQILGDALAEISEADLKLAPVSQDDYLTKIGERLLATLPPSGLHYRFRIYDSGEINAFSLGGGRVYISRKMIAATQSEDELAGVVAHEIGHIATHQFAVEFTRTFKVRLGVTQLTDRADIFARVHQMLSTPAKPNEAEEKEQKDQLFADHAALFALVRAGYAVESFASFLDKSMVNKGKTGNWLTDAFGITNEASQRYRTSLKLIAALPPGCKGKPPIATSNFLAWQRSVIQERIQSQAASVEGDKPLKLEKPLRPSLWRIRFSPNGQYILAQDEAGITIVDKDKGKTLFRVDAPDVEAAQFSPDSERLVFHDTKLRVEQWSVATGQRLSVKEMVLFDDCDQSALTPDAKTLVCVSVKVNDDGYPRFRLRLVDVESGNAFFDNPKFYEGNRSQLYFDYLNGGSVAEILISPDGRSLVVATGLHAAAYDLEHRLPLSLSGKLRDLGQVRMSFLGSDRLYVVGEAGKEKGTFVGRTLSFPDGRVLKEARMGSSRIGEVTKGDLLVVSPLKDFSVGVWDPVLEKIVAASHEPAIDVWDQSIAFEDGAGGLRLAKIGEKGSTPFPITLGQLPHPRAALFSQDGKYLAVSLKDRAEIWDLETGQPVGLFRPFRTAWIDEDDQLFVQCPRFADKDPVELKIALHPLNTQDLGKFENEDLQYHDFQMRYKPNGKGKETFSNAAVEMKKMGTQTVAWSHPYSHETPAYWPAEDQRLVLAWDLSNDTAKAEIKSHPALQKELDLLSKGKREEKKRGLLIETVMPETGAPLEQVVIPEADLTRGSNDVRRATISGEFVLVKGEHGNTVIYRMTDGSKVGEFFGQPVATDAGAGLIAATNRDEEILLVDEETGKEIKRFSFGSPVRLARIITDREKALLVLTADQVVHRIPLPSADAMRAAQ